MGHGTNHNSCGISEISQQRMSTISGIMEALTDGGTVIVGVYGTQSCEISLLLEKVSRKPNRDNLSDKVVMVRLTSMPDFKRIQGEVAGALGFTMEEKSEAKRAGICVIESKCSRRFS